MSIKFPSSFLLATIATGVAIGILIAPASGKKTRKAIVNTKDDLHYLALKAGDVVTALQHKLSALRDAHGDTEPANTIEAG
ncbi:MAG TPA: YtxH domain-containing protein [Flavobacteriales bacterium]|mgnify:FL=1|nr:YtxH domain-containing protein [Flavobacteriales bacterium]